MNVSTIGRNTTFRDSMDDMATTATGDTAEQAAHKLLKDAGETKETLRKDNMILNDAKEQTYGATAADKEAWERATGRKALGQVKALGVHH